MMRLRRLLWPFKVDPLSHMLRHVDSSRKWFWMSFTSFSRSRVIGLFGQSHWIFELSLFWRLNRKRSVYYSFIRTWWGGGGIQLEVTKLMAKNIFQNKEISGTDLVRVFSTSVIKNNALILNFRVASKWYQIDCFSKQKPCFKRIRVCTFINHNISAFAVQT